MQNFNRNRGIVTKIYGEGAFVTLPEIRGGLLSCAAGKGGLVSEGLMSGGLMSVPQISRHWACFSSHMKIFSEGTKSLFFKQQLK